jgi:hypothetical protein
MLSTFTVSNRNSFINLPPEIIDTIPEFDKFFSFVSPHAILSNAPNIIANKNFCLLNFTPHDIHFNDDLHLAINKRISKYTLALANYSLIASYQHEEEEEDQDLIFLVVRKTDSTGRYRMERICLDFKAEIWKDCAHGPMRGTKISDKDKFLHTPQVIKLMENLPSFTLKSNFEVVRFHDFKNDSEVTILNFTSVQIHFASDRLIWVDGIELPKFKAACLFAYQIPGDLKNVWFEYIDPISSKLKRRLYRRVLIGREPYTHVDYVKIKSKSKVWKYSLENIKKIMETYILLFCAINQAYDETGSNLTNSSSLHVCGMTNDILYEIANKMLLLPNKKTLKYLDK